ncbi:MAG: CopG family ribbon-helix-helix protein [Candidatus Helarchaeota archaeon]
MGKDTNNKKPSNPIISISIPDSLLEKLDTIINERGYSSRSEAIRDSIRGYISDYNWESNLSGNIDVIIVFTYEKTSKLAIHKIYEILHQEKYDEMIVSNLHLHIESGCIEVLVVKGDAKSIRALHGSLSALKEINLVKVLPIS